MTRTPTPPPTLFRLALTTLVAWAVAACDDGGSNRADTDGADDTAEVVDTAGDTAEVVDTFGDTTGDTADAEVHDTSVDTLDAADTHDLVDAEVSACDLPPGDPAFADHTVTRFDSVDCFFDYAGPFTSDPVAMKYVILDFEAGTPAEAEVRFYQNGFYQLHDEWYWFRLLNGQPIPGLASPAPVTGLSFASIADVYEAFAGQTSLPLDLAFIGGGGMAGRLYSNHFYKLAGVYPSDPTPRFFSLGTVLHLQPNPLRKFPGEIWGFELEYSDQVDVAELERIFAVLEAKLPPEVTAKLRWIARSTPQQTLAMSLAQGGHPLGSRTLRYSDLVVTGNVEVYNEGIAAGRVKVHDEGFSPTEVQAGELAVIPNVPDDIPPSRAIISAVPQTALAHVNLLAKSRGTPNAHVAGILEWTQLGDWEFIGQPLIFEAKDGKVRWQMITSDQLAMYEQRLLPPERHVEQVPDLASAPLTVSLTEPTDGALAAMKALVPLAGGKAAGFLSFLTVPSMQTPDLPLAVTIKSFREHMEDLDPLIRQALVDPDFADARVRYLVLEGEAAYREANAEDPAALGVMQAILLEHEGDAIGEIVGRGGARQMVIDKPMRYETLRDLRGALEARFAPLARTQGLRFRSSSTAEDVPGFNGAGLYVSNTGFLYPSELSNPDDRRKTVELAIKQTWASYWGFQAFEERKSGRIDHFEGAMGIAAHPRFDDNKEKANAVATFWISSYGATPTWRLVINVQEGALAVTNPGGTSELPEIDEVVVEGDGAPQIVRVQHSTLSEDAWLFSDEELLTLYAQAKEHAGKWLEAAGASLSNAERPRTLVLDYELKYMKAGWPALASGEVRPERILWRQARVLDQVERITTQADPFVGGAIPLAVSMPRDLRTVSRLVVVDRCKSSWGDFRVYRLYTEPSAAELFPFADEPFVYRGWIDFDQAPAGLSPKLTAYYIPWTGLSERSSNASGSRVVLDAANAGLIGVDGYELTAPVGGGAATFRVWKGETSFSGTCTTWERKSPYQSAAELLRALLPAP